MSDEKIPPADDPPLPDPGANPPPSAPPDAAPLEIMPDAPAAPAGANPPTPAGETGQALLIPAPPGAAKPPAPPAPIDYAMPSSKTWIPSPALIRNLGCIFKMLFGFTVLLILGYVMLMALNPKARQWALQGSQPEPGGFPTAGGTRPAGGGSGIGGGRGPTPFKAVNQILALPAQALAKTDDVVQANNARAGMLDGVIADEEAKAKAAGRSGGPGAPPANPFLAAQAAAAGTPGAKNAKGGKAGEETDPAEAEKAAQVARIMALQEKLAAQAASGQPAPKADAVRSTAIQTREPDTLAPVTLPGGIVIRSASPEGAPPATRAFLYWVVNLNISGINPPRLLLQGRLIHEGQEVNLALGIVLHRIDPVEKLIHFRDQTGAVVTRSY